MTDKDPDKTIINVRLSSQKRDSEGSHVSAHTEESSLISDDKTRIRNTQKTLDADAASLSSEGKVTDPTLRIWGDGEIPDDKTRIKGKISGDLSIENDNTTHGEVASTTLDSDDLNIASRSDSDLTRFNPKLNVPEDKTRIRQVSKSQASDFESAAAPGMTDDTQYDVLKGRFVLEKVLGAGGMGIVYKAKDLLKVEAQDRDPYVAIKVLSDEFKAHPEAFISLQRESRKSQRIAHPNIVNVHDFDRDGDTVFMTMEYMEGSPLDKLIKQYKSTGLPTDDAWSIINDVSSALSHAHAQNISHSDFKPGNIFVTNKGVAKVFDFGISRAVAIAEHVDDNPEDKTIFDAGTLGALTPAYASLEMLQGQKPDVRDDVFALGCVAYEVLTGEHPYNRVPADEAEKQGLKPKRILTIKKFQWKAIEKAIALRCENRTESVDRFIHDLVPKIKTTNGAIMLTFLVLSIGLTVYLAFFQEKSYDPYEEFNIRNEIELQVRIDFYKNHLASLLTDANFSEGWQDDVWKDVSDLLKLTQGDAPWVYEERAKIYTMYLSQIDRSIKSFKIRDAEVLLKNAKRYTDDEDELNVRMEALADARKQIKSNSAKQQAASEQAAIVSEKKKKAVELFDLALENVNIQLKCQGRINMPDFESAINKLRETDSARYKKIETNIVKSFGSCIQQIGKAFPERAIEAKKLGARIFGANSYLENIKIQPRDSCDISLAGLGARGRRAVCNDQLPGKSSGPDLVVIPGMGSIKPFAIGKYEISIREVNQYCKDSADCQVISGRDQDLPVTKISFSLAKDYMKWLSRKTGKKYRLPTMNEWRYAAKASKRQLDANRNCKLSARGIQKGEELVKAAMGAQNDWGVVNSVGNVQEWVYGKGRTLVAAGGSYDHPMDSCNFETVKDQSGDPDMYTGFRVLREIGAIQ